MGIAPCMPKETFAWMNNHPGPKTKVHRKGALGPKTGSGCDLQYQAKEVQPHESALTAESPMFKNVPYPCTVVLFRIEPKAKWRGLQNRLKKRRRLEILMISSLLVRVPVRDFLKSGRAKLLFNKSQ